MLLLFYIGSFVEMGEYGTHRPPLFDWSTQLKSLATVFGNTVFVFIYHHSIPGIMYPVRPQSSVNSMFLVANIVGASLLVAEGQLAVWSFGSIKHNCKVFPCEVQDLYSENF